MQIPLFIVGLRVDLEAIVGEISPYRMALLLELPNKKNQRKFI